MVNDQTLHTFVKNSPSASSSPAVPESAKKLLYPFFQNRRRKMSIIIHKLEEFNATDGLTKEAR